MKWLFVFVLSACVLPAKQKVPKVSELDRFIAEATSPDVRDERAPGSLFFPGGPLLDLAADLRARRVNDIVTVVVLDRASAVARGTTKTARNSSADASISSLAGATPPGGDRLTNLLKMGTKTSLDGQGETTRETVLNTTLTARVSRVLPNGFLLVEGSKSVRVNSEVQEIGIRGVVRPVDLTPLNRIESDRLAYLEITVNGKGVVGDAVRRPNILYRLLLGVLPF